MRDRIATANPISQANCRCSDKYREKILFLYTIANREVFLEKILEKIKV